MADGHSWEVVCIEWEEEPDFDDCRGLDKIGYMAASLQTKRVDSVGSMIDSGISNYHLDLDGVRIPLKAATDNGYYVRTEDQDTPDDPLLNLPTFQEYKMEEKFKP